MNSKDRAPAAPPAEQADSLPDAQSMRLFNELVATRSQPDEINEQCLLKLWNMARPERFELPTLWFEVRCEAFLKSIECRRFYVLLVEDIVASLLVFVELCGSRRRPRLRNRLQ
jgi:hypothetical protein